MPRTPRAVPHRAHVLLAEAHRLAGVGEQHDIVVAVRDGYPDEVVALVQLYCNDAARARTREFGKRRLLDRTAGRRHKDEVPVVEGLDRQYRVDLLVLLEMQEIVDRLATRAPAALRDRVYLHPIHPAPAGKAQDVVMGVGNEQTFDEVVFFGGGRLLAPPAALLGPVVGQRLGFDVAGVRQRNHDVGGRDKVFEVEVLRVELDLAAALVAILVSLNLFSSSEMMA